MNCVNCACRLTFFNETDELWGGTERALCHSCRQKIAPFLEEVCVGSHVDHLRERKEALTARGVTAEGYAHLDEYCRYLDALMKKPAIPDDPVQPQRRRKPDESPLAALRRTIRQEPAEEQSEASEGSHNDHEITDMVVRSNQLIRADIRELGTQQTDTMRVLADKLERTQERLRLLTYLAGAGAASGLLAFLGVMLSLIIR